MIGPNIYCFHGKINGAREALGQAVRPGKSEHAWADVSSLFLVPGQPVPTAACALGKGLSWLGDLPCRS